MGLTWAWRLVVVSTIVIGGAMLGEAVHDKMRRRADSRPSGFRVGDTLTLGGRELTSPRATATLVIYAWADRLVDPGSAAARQIVMEFASVDRRGSGARVVVTTNDAARMQAGLVRAGIRVDEVIAVNGARSGFRAFPTLALLDRRAVIQRLWFGWPDWASRQEIKSILASPVADED